MKEKTDNASFIALAAAVMSVITIFGGATVFLGVFFALFAIVAAARGKRKSPTKTARRILIFSVFGIVLSSAVSVLFLFLFFSSSLSLPEIDFDTTRFYEWTKELIIRFINKI